ncbi:TM221 protein, partial [Bombycilla garrulus]|nr:TM221 protein [Bombycilla garrulus]
ALALFMLLLFEPEAGIASACVLTSGILVLLLSVLHASQISRASRIPRPEHPGALYENDGAQPGDKNVPQTRETRREFSFPIFLQRKSRPGSASSGSKRSSGGLGSTEFQREFQKEFQRDLSRTHRTLEEDSGLFLEQGKPWNVVTREMRNAMSRKATGKDSTLV